METKFQTSFIPKKPLVTEQKIVTVKSGTNVLMIVGALIFLASLAGAVYSVVWKNVLIKQRDEYKAQLIESQNRFNTTLIENLKKVNTKIDLAKLMLNNHLATPEIFDIISSLTTENVRFNTFSFTAPSKDGEGVKVSLSGVAKDFYTIAFQSDVFGKSSVYGKQKLLKDPVVSDVSETENGSIKFGFNATINPVDIQYKKLMKENTDYILPASSSTLETQE